MTGCVGEGVGVGRGMVWTRVSTFHLPPVLLPTLPYPTRFIEPVSNLPLILSNLPLTISNLPLTISNLPLTITNPPLTISNLPLTISNPHLRLRCGGGLNLPPILGLTSTSHHV